MAILKHVSSHNPNYSAVIDYLTKEHDEETGKALLDEYGQMVERDEYLIEGINCTPENFALMCEMDSFRFRTNRNKTDIKTHQYILSFDPKDREKGLTLAAVQEEGMAFAKRNFPGHRCIVCSHPDGSNGSGNIHVHIVISALRFEDREPNDQFMKLKKDGSVKVSEYKAGRKHQDTARLRIYLNRQLQEYCRENGYTVAKSKPPKKVSNKEHRAQIEGQKQLDKDNKKRRETGQKPAQKVFKTKKDDLRTVISHAASISKDWDELANNLRTAYSRQVETRPVNQRMPFKQRQELWSRYKDLNDMFWINYKEQTERKKQELDYQFQLLRMRKDLEWQSRNRKNSFFTRLGAVRRMGMTDDQEIIKYQITSKKEDQKKLRLNKNIYQTYAKAAKIALANDMKAAADHCLARMEEIQKRQKGYWADGYNSESEEFDIRDLDRPKYYMNWRMTKEYELDDAKKALQYIQKKSVELEERQTQSEIREEPFSIDIKVTRGVVSFKHPDLEHWTRGKSLGAEFEMEALARVMEENRLRELDDHYRQALEDTSAITRTDSNSYVVKSREFER